MNPESEKAVADDARKFVITSGDPRAYAKDGVVSFRLITNWLKTGESTETKVVYKDFTTGAAQALLIVKRTAQDGRTVEKRIITDDEYKKLLPSSILEIEKERHEFSVEQNGELFEMKFDMFTDSTLRVLEVDGSSRDDFDPGSFMGGCLREVSGDKSYEGYRVANKIKLAKL